MMIPLGYLGVAAPADFELISTQVLSGFATSVTFSSIPSSYKHLQLRMTLRDNAGSVTDGQSLLQFNGDTTAGNYAYHWLQGNGSSASSGSSITQPNIQLGHYSGGNNSAGMFSPTIVDILDYTSTNKNKTVRSFAGNATASTFVGLYSGIWLNTGAITSIRLTNVLAGSYVTNSRFSLYGIRG